jgi:hypothetical protein
MMVQNIDIVEYCSVESTTQADLSLPLAFDVRLLLFWLVVVGDDDGCGGWKMAIGSVCSRLFVRGSLAQLVGRYPHQ